jgi:hypothetical protein
MSRRPQTTTAELLERLRAAVLDGPGELDRSVRQAVFTGNGAPGDAAAYVDKVRRQAYTVTDGDIESLQGAGWSDDAIFELTVATALGAVLSRRETARQAMGA